MNKTESHHFSKHLLPTPSKVAKRVNIPVADLISTVGNISHSSLNNLRKANPEKYAVIILGLLSKNYDLDINDLMILKEKKEILKKIY